MGFGAQWRECQSCGIASALNPSGHYCEDLK
jgi:hypothetical protein